MKKLFLTVLAHIAVSSAVCAACSSLLLPLPELVPGAEGGYKALRALLLFLDWLPASAGAGFLVGAAVSLGGVEGGAVRRFRLVVLSSLACVFAVFFSGEVVRPVVSASIFAAEAAPRVFRTFLDLGNRCFQNGNMEMALRYASEALAVNPADEEARKLRENAVSLGNAEVDVPHSRQSAPAEEVVTAPEPVDVNYSWHETSGRSAEELLRKAEEAELDGRWIDAHYFALLAASTAGEGTELRRKARLQAAHYWGVLREPVELSDTPEMRLYRLKKAAYTQMSTGDNVGAYFTFREMLETNELARDDPDVKKFLALVTERLKRTSFFTDELENLRKFESRRNVRFSVPKADGSVDVVSVRGVTPVRESGRSVQYLRGLSVFTFGSGGEFVRSVYAPFARLTFEDAALLPEAERAAWGVGPLGEVPFVMLHGLDSKIRGREVRPVATFADGAEGVCPETLLLALGREDYEMLCSASQGERLLSPGKLWSLFKRASGFGYAAEPFGAQLLRCFAYPLFLLVLFIFLAKIAWNNRVEPGLVFKFKWIFVLPVLTALLYVAVSLLDYAVRTLSFAFVASFGASAVVAALIVGLAGLLYVSTSFILHAHDGD